jgi:hypothetical protein
MSCRRKWRETDESGLFLQSKVDKEVPKSEAGLAWPSASCIGCRFSEGGCSR